ncbi:hypothetical protein C0995_008504 [Termitomyces sp. Mi166|nr:hypothetical protein C0995_008504 [Termitomyces sp. Mi166\
MSSAQKAEQEWQAILTPEQFRVLRKKGTEPPGTGEYDHHFAEGVYNCAGCGAPLYKSSTNADIGSAAIPGAVSRHEDKSFGTIRTEIVCTACGGHLGHVFKGEGFQTPSKISRCPSRGSANRSTADERHCVNSISLKFHDGK